MNIEPVLMKFAVARTGVSELPGRYDNVRQVWMVNTATGELPIVQASKERPLAELVTKTDAAPERDDPTALSILELATKTAHQLERDDVDPAFVFLELVTVTKVSNERSDI